jgi:hypothetical protein
LIIDIPEALCVWVEDPRERRKVADHLPEEIVRESYSGLRCFVVCFHYILFSISNFVM